MKRIVVIGSAGAGKTTLARQLSAALSLPHTEMDALYWEPHWQESDHAAFRAKLRPVIAAERWVLDGNYTSAARELVWQRADTLVWLDYDLRVCLWRLMGRTLKRVVRQNELWPGTGNRESLRLALSPDSVIFYMLKTHQRRRERYAQWMMEGGVYPHLRWVRHRRPAEAHRWLVGLDDDKQPPHGEYTRT